MGCTYPDMVKRAAPIAGTAKNTIHDSLFTETLVEAITSDAGFNNGFYASSADVSLAGRNPASAHASASAQAGSAI
jgi:homoserine acetyltransferase